MRVGTQFGWQGLTDLIAKKMDHGGALFGIPINPREFPDFRGETSQQHSHHLKASIADKALNYCMERAKFEVRDWLRGKIEKDGLNHLKAILKGESVFGDLLVEK